MRTRIAAATAAAMLGSVVLVTGATPARADSAVALTAKGASDLVADSVHKRLFFNDHTRGEIVAIGYDGTPFGSYSLPSLTDITLAPDSSVLYAAAPNSHKIVALDPVTLDLIGEYKLGDTISPYYLAVVGTKVWFGHTDGWTGEIGSLDLSGENPVTTLETEAGDWLFRAPRLAASANGRLVATARGQYASFDVSDGTPKLLSQRAQDDDAPYDVAITADGERYVTVDSRAVLTVRQVADQTEVRTLGVDHYAEAVDIAEDGTIAAGSDSAYGPDIATFAPGTNEKIREYDFPNTGYNSGGDGMDAQALAWEPGGNRLFVITSNSVQQYSLRSYDQPRSNRPVLTLTGPSSAPRARALTIGGTLKATVTLPAGTPVSVTRTDIESPAGRSLGTRTINASGGFSFTDTPPAGGRVVYKVSYAGDATHYPVSASRTVNVARATTSLTLTNNGKVYNYGQTVTFTAHLGTTYKNRVVEIWADPYGGDLGRRLLRRATVDSRGDVVVSLKLYRNTAVQAVFAGDGRYTDRTVGSTVYSRVPVSLKLGKYYKTGKISGRTFRYFKKSSKPTFTVAMPRYPNREAYLHVDIWYQGRWRTAFYGDVPVNSKGQAVANISAQGLTGYKFRVRAAYRKGYSGDSVNYSTYTTYQYFTVN
ncbi:hypothetical protein Q0Z83_083350 [Actinoplanes sichuanensis]|uniref:Ig-like domain repeat protein n=1 Tax=Actinoplanes sichuanensis TaxID=512349 RepID=A0ABW4AC76_9ACTN|nr:hypothetical protein [Actinoplanes sichuanensis]BEL10144.1 hypothetical protein Q0Z83_083350 [Actinoplanes sichuanensis]